MMRYHHGRQDVPADAAAGRASQTETDAPDAMVERLMGRCFRVFYAGLDGKRWLQDQRGLMQALTWPAVWLNERGVGMPVAEYEAKLGEVIETIERHGDVRRIKLVPAYLLDCVRKHFAHHGDEIYAARKHVRNAFDLALLQGGKVAPQRADVVPALVAAHGVLATSAKRRKVQADEPAQGTLF